MISLSFQPLKAQKLWFYVCQVYLYGYFSGMNEMATHLGVPNKIELCQKNVLCLLKAKRGINEPTRAQRVTTPTREFEFWKGEIVCPITFDVNLGHLLQKLCFTWRPKWDKFNVEILNLCRCLRHFVSLENNKGAVFIFLTFLLPFLALLFNIFSFIKHFKCLTLKVFYKYFFHKVDGSFF